MLKSHLLWIASYHAGNGWYLEQSYNYYTISLFVVYGTIWNRAFGDQYYPEIAAVLEKSFKELFETYANFFGRDGYINMWARSICYRLWISGGFPVSFMLKSKPPIDPGWARRLCSGSHSPVHRAGGFLRERHPSAGLLRPPRVCDPELQLPGQPVHHVPAVHRAGLAGGFAVLDREGKRRHVDRAWEKLQAHRAGETRPGAGQPRQQRHFGNHFRQGL